MSYDYFLQAHLNQDSQDISTDSILKILEKYVAKKGEGFVDLQFDKDNSCTFYFELDEPYTNSININRPCTGEEFIRCIYQIMQLGNFVFFEPEGNYSIVLNEKIEIELPEDMIESLGKPVIANDFEEFRKFLLTNRD
jgi:hypothetical protein